MGASPSFMQTLFGGTTPPGVNTYNQNLTNIPSWLLNDTNALMQQATAVAGTPYQSFPGPQVAPWTADQLQAQQQVEGMQGGYKPTLDAATNLASMSANPGQFATAQSYLPTAQNYISSAMSPSQAQMNPYIGNVIQQAENQATQYWNNTLLPSINNQYVGSGQAGSSANTRALGQAGAQVTQNIQDTANAALSGGYTAAQQAGLAGGQAMGTLAQLQGGLGYEQGILGLQGSGQLGTLASLGQNLGMQGAGTLYNMGQAQQGQGQANLNTAYTDWLNQTQYPQSQLSWLGNMIHGTASPATTGGATSGTNAGYLPGSQYGATPFNSALGMYTGLNG